MVNKLVMDPEVSIMDYEGIIEELRTKSLRDYERTY